MRWEVRGRTYTVLQSVVSRIHSKQYIASLCSFHQDFPSNVSFKFNKCNQTVVLTCFILSERSDVHIIDNLSTFYLCVC